MIFQKYFNNKELSQTEQYILIGLLAKEADLIGTYTVKHLREHPEYIKSEINVGIFDNIVLSGKTYTNKERKEIATLGKVWSKDDLNKMCIRDSLLVLGYGLVNPRICVELVTITIWV